MMAKKKPVVRKKTSETQPTWALNLTKNQLELVCYYISVAADVIQEELDAGTKEQRSEKRRDVKDCRTVQAMSHLGLVNMEIAIHVRKKGLVK
jgi:hypothetical protein